MGYLYLGLAIVGELIGTTFLKYSEGYTKLIPSIVSILSYAFCFYIFSKSLLMNIHLSVAYATWSAVGLIITTLISILIFKEGITFAGVIAIVMITIGVIILNLYGTPSH
ncbi:DMT family transporter [Clostridium aminobutyricum]|uniref:Multidrug efflux SMR transporter n=1 Tax=Clostridium aminobutyricum TaxID=33953 RepID=A0A939D6A4_CLOAM|nr:multidrug efflux SMR transporter [Clostridium aminobutyricum]MBN7771862.1 multidrug efflux SMR transporter [Clostridium aminobutyricum]